MLIITGLIDAGGRSRDEIAALTGPMAKATRAEDGCLAYAFYEDLEQPGSYRIYEEWESEAHLHAHFATPHMADFQAKLKELGEIKIDVGRYDSEGRRGLR